MESELVKWALDTIGKMPPVPVPSLVAFVVVILLAMPLFRKARRESKQHPIEKPAEVEPHTPWFITTLVNIDLRQERLAHDMAQLRDDVSEMKGQITLIDRMLRRRSGRSKKLKTPTTEE